MVGRAREDLGDDPPLEVRGATAGSRGVTIFSTTVFAL